AGGAAARSRMRVGIEGRQNVPGRAFAGAALRVASGSGMGAVSHADQEPLYVRIGDASGGRKHGRARETVGAGGAKRWDLICHRLGKSRGRAALLVPRSCAVTEMRALAQQALKGLIFPPLTRP